MSTRVGRARVGGTRWGVLAVLMVLAITAASCSDDDTAETVVPTTAPAPTTVPRLSDGVLRLGVLLPQTGPGSEFGLPLVTAVERAVDVVNDHGGVLGRQVELVVADEGSDVATAGTSMERLVLEEAVDAVIGPASSRVALAVLDQAVSAGALVCSPAAAAISLSRFPDQNLFLRTIPSDALQAQAMARVIDQTGLGSVAITFPDDVYGRSFAEALRSALSSLGIPIVTDVPYDPAAPDHSADIVAVLAGVPPVVAVIGDNDAGVEILTELIDAARFALPMFVTSDALRRPVQPSLLADLSPTQLSRVKGVSPVVLPQSPALLELLGLASGDPAGAFAAQAFDCVNLIALAATQAGSDDPTDISSAIATISRGGSSCPDFPTCVDLLNQGRNIDYDGYEGEVRLDSNGDMAVGRFERFGFGADGRDAVELRFEVGATN